MTKQKGDVTPSRGQARRPYNSLYINLLTIYYLLSLYTLLLTPYYLLSLYTLRLTPYALHLTPYSLLLTPYYPSLPSPANSSSGSIDLIIKNAAIGILGRVFQSLVQGLDHGVH